MGHGLDCALGAICRDNLAAITACAMFYGIEVAAIMAVLQQYPEGDAKAVRDEQYSSTYTDPPAASDVCRSCYVLWMMYGGCMLLSKQ